VLSYHEHMEACSFKFCVWKWYKKPVSLIYYYANRSLDSADAIMTHRWLVTLKSLLQGIVPLE